MKTKIVGTGLTGLVGSRVAELLKDHFDFINVSTETGGNITKPETLIAPIEKSDAKIILHFAAKTDVDSCEMDKELGENGLAWKINVTGTQNIINAAKKSGKKIIYISTDFVFDGENLSTGGYTEEDKPNPKNWYALTKYEGEKLIANSQLPYLIVRIAYPYRAKFDMRKDFLRSIKDKLANGKKIYALVDHIFTPTFIDDVAYAIKVLINTEAQGIFHVVGSSHLTPLEAAFLIADTFSLPRDLIEKTERAVYFKDQAFRPFQLALKNDKIKKLGISMSSFNEGLRKIKEQMCLH